MAKNAWVDEAVPGVFSSWFVHLMAKAENALGRSEEAIASGRFEVVSVAGLLAKAIRRIHYGESVSSLFV